MYVCVCQAVTDKAILEAVADGASNLDDLRSGLGVSANCGQCACTAEQIIESALQPPTWPCPTAA